MWAMSQILAEKSSLGPRELSEQEQSGRLSPAGCLQGGTMETDRPMWDWRRTGKLPGGRGTGGHQVEDIARAKENGRASSASAQARAWVLLGQPT